MTSKSQVDQYLLQIEEAVHFIREYVEDSIEFGVVLGTGLGNFVNLIDVEQIIEYENIPNFPIATVESHKGKLIIGKVNGKSVLVMQGRFHYYEGYTMKEVTFPIRVMNQLGIQKLLISNVSGSIHENFDKGDLVFIEDHIYLQYENPLTGPNLDSYGPRFPDMSEPYCRDWINKAQKFALAKNYNHHIGTYASVPGPNLETKAEYQYLHTIGANIVGMSTVPEVLVGVHCGMKIFAISVITDKNYPLDLIEPLSIEDVIRIALEAEPRMTDVLSHMISIC